MYLFIEAIQIVAAFIPGAPIEVMGGVLFGGFFGVVWCTVGALGTVIVFFLVRKFGRPFVYKIFPKQKLDDVKILNDKKAHINCASALCISRNSKGFPDLYRGTYKNQTDEIFSDSCFRKDSSNDLFGSYGS
ncbi:MAG: hypothetical protein LUG26_04470 [Ruminococcus sp.]|nr:hypothetical protein [Ruminococcus sp.]